MKSTLKRNTSGFTLIEIIIVVIIVGILASLAVPKFAQQLDAAKGAEAYNMAGAFYRSIDRCFAISETLEGCDTWADIDMKTPTDNRFNYHFVDSGAEDVSLRACLASDTTCTASADGVDYIKVQVTSANQELADPVITAGGVFAKTKK